jgi:hypothetical protein
MNTKRKRRNERPNNQGDATTSPGRDIKDKKELMAMVEKKSLVKRYLQKISNIIFSYLTLIFFSYVGLTLAYIACDLLDAMKLSENFGPIDRVTILMLAMIMIVIIFGIMFVLLELINITRRVDVLIENDCKRLEIIKK